MIISHKHKFIFIKPRKVAGTSIEINLAKHCGAQDIITPLTDYNQNSDTDYYLHQAQNNNGLDGHIYPNQIKRKVGKKIWHEYFKFTVVRNPWDVVVSRYWWEKTAESTNFLKNLNKNLNQKTILNNLLKPRAYLLMLEKIMRIFIKNKMRQAAKQGDFEYFVKNFKGKKWENKKFYFDPSGKPWCNFYIRYENLEEDYKKICQYVGISYEKLPQTKNKGRKDKTNYSIYYNERTKQIIKDRFAKEINLFGYDF